MAFRRRCIDVALGLVLAFPLPTSAQSRRTSNPISSTLPSVAADYPHYRAGIFIYGSDWLPIPNETPAKTHLKHAFAPAFTYGIAPAEAISDYAGLHAQVQVESDRPEICICHILSLPGKPALVRLHPKKDFRELDGGRLHIGAKFAKAEKNDLIPIDVSQPESMVWLIQPEQIVPPGEYALMLGTQNLSIFPFSVISLNSSTAASEKR
jgi:hypothetical protein